MRSRTWLISSLGAGALVGIVAACTKQEVSLGTNDAPLVAIDPATVSGAATACAANAAHPNVCCAPGLAACAMFEGAPFHACPAGDTTYADPRTCCDLTDPSKCRASVPKIPVGAVSCDAGSDGCLPGWYSDWPGICCRVGGAGVPVCYAPPPDGGWWDGGPIWTPDDSGTFDASANGDAALFVDGGAVAFPDGGTCSGGDPDAGSQVCPPGWQTAIGVPNLCCRDDGLGGIDCFSTGGGVPWPADGGSHDAGPYTVDSGPVDEAGPDRGDAGAFFFEGGAPSRDAASIGARVCNSDAKVGTCDCTEGPDGGAYDLQCSDTFGCTCYAPDGTWRQYGGLNVCSNGSVDAVWRSFCGFPQ